MLNQNSRSKIPANDALPPNNHIHKTKSAFLSPSREKFIREHSASPFATEDKESADNKSVNSEKRKRRSLKLGSSWFKSIAANSPILNTLISKSNTTGKKLKLLINFKFYCRKFGQNKQRWKQRPFGCTIRINYKCVSKSVDFGQKDAQASNAKSVFK